VKVQEGDLVEINLTTDRNDVYGYQFTLSTPGLNLVDVQGVEANHVAEFDGQLTMSYNTNEVMAAGTMVTLVMKATTSASVSELLNMGSELTRAEAYVGSDLDIVSIDLKGSGEDASFDLYQNEPNPFNEYTVIGFELPSAGQATLSLYDVTGKVLKVVDANFNQGYNSVKITKEDLGVSGMIYYQLQAANYSAVKHMIIID